MADADFEAGVKILSIREANSKDFFKVLKSIEAFSKAEPVKAFRTVIQAGSINRLSQAEGNKIYRELQLTPIKSLKLVKILPFGTDAAISERDEDIFIKATSNLNLDFYSNFPEIMDYVKRFTQEENHNRHDHLELYANITLIAQIFAKQFGEVNQNLGPRKGRTDIFVDLDHTFIEFLLSLHSTNIYIISKFLCKFLAEFYQRLIIMQQSLGCLKDNSGKDPSYLVNLNKLIQSTGTLISSLQPIGNTELTADGFVKDKSMERRLMPLDKIRDFMSNLSNYTGAFLSKNPPRTGQIIGRLGYNNRRVRENTAPYVALDNWIYQLFHGMFKQIKIAGNDNISNYQTRKEIFSIKSSAVILRDFIESGTNIKSEEYEDLIDRARHLKESSLKGEHQKIDKIIEDINKMSHSLKSNIAGIVSSVEYPPDYWREVIEALEIENDVDARWKNRINDFDRYMSSSKSKKSEKDGLIFIAENNIFTYGEIHGEMKSSINLWLDCRAEFDKTKGELRGRTTDPKLKETVQRELTRLTDNRISVIENYIELKENFLNNITTKNPDSKNNLGMLEDFSESVNVILEEFAEKIREAANSGIVTHSGPSAAMMIGLGQGGEAIVRAAMAKMLNNHTDTRCANLLSGLNINMREVNESIETFKKSDDSYQSKYDFSVDASDEDDLITRCFENANIIAINAGPEQKRMLNQKYNYIWGRRGGQHLGGAKKDTYVKLSTNSILVDSNSEGSGGKMGKGRAYAVAAEEAIENTLRAKRRNQRIKQICVVHSYAGGSGSGMILPVLRMVKRVFPTSLVWILSAGEIENGKSVNDPHNLVYITSDILQSHYNALHHTPEIITKERWDKFARTTEESWKSLGDTWEKIIPFIANGNEGYAMYKESQKSGLSKLIEDIKMVTENKSIKGIGFNVDNEQTTSLFDILPKTDVSVDLFQNAVRDPKYYQDIDSIWKDWHQLAEDPASSQLSTANELNQILKSDEKLVSKDRTDFPLSYLHLIRIIDGIKKLVEVKFDSEEALRVIDEDNAKGNAEIANALKKYGAQMNIVSQPDQTLEETAIQLQKDIKKYATTMRNYHNDLQLHYELIKLNLVMKNDNLIKHIIVSNAHFDSDAKSLVPNRTNNYEIYNSVMADTFINLVHNMVQKNLDTEESEEELSQSAIISRSNSSEAMDLSDVSYRTNPSLAAISLSLNDVTKLSSSIRYEADYAYGPINEEIIYNEVFRKMFNDRTSPLFDKEKFDYINLPPHSFASFYDNYFRQKSSVFTKYSPHEVLELSDNAKEAIFQHCNSFDTKVKDFWDAINDSLSPENKKELIEEKEFSLDSLKNMVNWLVLLNPKIVSNYYAESDRQKFVDMTNSWLGSWGSAFMQGKQDDVTNPKFRMHSLLDTVSKKLPQLKTQELTSMTNMLFELGLLNESHIAVMPSSFVYDFAPLIMARQITADSDYELLLNVGTDGYDAKSFNLLEPRYPTVTEQLVENDDNWLDAIRNTLPKSQLENNEISMTIKSENHFTGYLQIRSPEDTYKTGKWRYDISSKFIKHFATIKCDCADDYDVFANNTLLNKLVNISSNVDEGSHKRHSSEGPKFKRSIESLSINSIPRKLHESEGNASLMFRYLILTNPVVEGTSLYTCARKSLQNFNDDWVKKVQQSGHQDFGTSFDPANFNRSVYERLESMAKSKNTFSDDKDMKFVFDKLVGCYEDFDSQGKPAHEIFRSLSDALFSKISAAINSIDGDIEYNKKVIEKELMSMSSLLTRLSSISYSAYCQFVFEQQPLSQEFGVSFEYEGSLDAIRSHQKDYLAVVNASSSISNDSIKPSIDAYYTQYLNQDVTGKVFVQALEKGPVCNLTLIQQNAGLAEVSEKFRSLMKKVSERKWAEIGDPLVHPYSFLRNILWMYTFVEEWVNKPTRSFSESIDIPDEVIRSVYSKPSLIDDTTNTIITDAKMKGLNLSRYDRDLWSDIVVCGRALIEDGQEPEDIEHYKRRMRGNLHIPDMLLICAAKWEIRKGNHDGDFTKALEHVASESKFPKDRWELKFIHDNIRTKFDGLKPDKVLTSETDNIALLNDKQSKSSFVPPWESKNEVSNDNPWIKALEKWVEFLTQSQE